MLPCKHILSLFEHCEEVNRQTLPKPYISSPYFNLDDSVFYQQSQNDTLLADNCEEMIDPSQCKDEVTFQEISKKVYPKKSKASSCREILNKLRSLTFVVYDNDSLEEQLSEILQDFGKSAPNDDGLVLEAVRPVRKAKFKEELPRPKV